METKSPFDAEKLVTCMIRAATKLREASTEIGSLAVKHEFATAQLAAMTKDRDEAVAAAREMREMLAKREWAEGNSNYYHGDDYCPVCHAWKTNGHDAGCPLGKILADPRWKGEE